MVEVRWTPQSSQDLESIVEFIAKDSFQYARLFAVDIFQAVDRIAQFPLSGRKVPELNNPAIREILLGSYRLVYRLREERAELLTVYHSAQLLDPGKLK